jgi:hypothetical protein
MPTAQQADQLKGRDQQMGEELKAIIGRHVLHALNDPSGLCKVQVRPLWSNYYRANVLVEDQAGTVTISHSYFLVVDGEGNIIEATPKITHLSGALAQ